jgi:DNA polymerase
MGPEKVLPEYKNERQIGKAAVLGLGYQMGAGRFLDELTKNGIEADEEFADDIVKKWRKSNPLIADWDRGIWRRLERAAKAAITSRGRGDFVGKVAAYSNPDIALRVRYEFGGMTIEIPSGRKLFYPQATIVEGNFGPSIRYKDGGKQLVDTYGGKLVENVVQAISRDLLVHSMFRAERAGLMVIGHVHDEVIVEHELDGIELAEAELDICMSTPPGWAAGLPLAAETYTSKRYTK